LRFLFLHFVRSRFFSRFNNVAVCLQLFDDEETSVLIWLQKSVTCDTPSANAFSDYQPGLCSMTVVDAAAAAAAAAVC